MKTLSAILFVFFSLFDVTHSASLSVSLSPSPSPSHETNSTSSSPDCVVDMGCIKYRRHVLGTTLTYIVHDDLKIFDNALSWCQGLNGQLPIIHSKHDFDFLMDTVIKNGSLPSFTWMGRKPVCKQVCSNEWLDGSQVEYNFESFPDAALKESRCIDCQNKNCCAMFVRNNLESHGQVGFASCGRDSLGRANPMRAVCVIR